MGVNFSVQFPKVLLYQVACSTYYGTTNTWTHIWTLGYVLKPDLTKTNALHEFLLWSHVCIQPWKMRVNNCDYQWAYKSIHLQHNVVQQTTFPFCFVVREEIIGMQKIICPRVTWKWFTPNVSESMLAAVN